MAEKKTHTDQKYIDGLAQNNSFIIQAIYTTYAPKVINYIKNNGGDATRAQDIIQETLITIYHQAINKKLQLTCPFDAYFFLLCKRKWLNQLKKKSNKEVTITAAVLYNNEQVEELVFETSIFEKKQKLFNLMFEKLGSSCKELLKKCFQTKSMNEVATSLQISYAYARKKKSQCIGKLTQLIKESKTYHQLKNDL